jgi:hypothetical protein
MQKIGKTVLPVPSLGVFSFTTLKLCASFRMNSELENPRFSQYLARKFRDFVQNEKKEKISCFVISCHCFIFPPHEHNVHLQCSHG